MNKNCEESLTCVLYSLGQASFEPLSWKELESLVKKTEMDLANGPTSSYSRLRLFGQAESSVRVTLYRSFFA